MSGMIRAKPTSVTRVPRGPHYQPLVVVLLSAAAGIVGDRLLGLALAAWWTIGVLTWAAWLVTWRRRLGRTAPILLLAAVAACAGAWHHACWHLFADDDLGCFARLAEQPVCVEAIARTGPRRQAPPRASPMRPIPARERTRIEVDIVGLRNASDWQPASGRARLTVDGHLMGVHAGDRIRVFAHFASTRPAHNPGEFDFSLHARGDRRRCVLKAAYPECVEVVRRAKPHDLSYTIERLRTAGDRLFWTYLDNQRSSLASAILLGAREEIDQEQTEAFMQTGTVHILSISGTHVGILAGAAFLFMRVILMPRVMSAILVALLTLAYTIVTDAEPPAVRAAVLVLTVAMAFCLGRRPLAFNSLAAAGLVVLVLNPADLFRTGVQLSFLCAAGLMWFTPRLSRDASAPHPLAELTRRSRPWPMRLVAQCLRAAWQLTCLGVLLWLLTAPLVLARFHLISPVAVVLNTILWIPMTLAIVTGFGVVLLGWLAPSLAGVCGWCCDGTFALLQAAIDGARRIPGSYFWMPGPADWWLLGFYCGLGLLAAFPRLRPPRRWCIGLAAGWVTVGFAVSWLQTEKGKLDCTFLAVDHGCAAVLELPSGAKILYDAGQFFSPEAGTQSIAAFLWSRGIFRLDAIVLSHPDADHFNAVPGLLERFSVGAVYVPPAMFDTPGAAVEALQTAIRGARVPIREICAGDQLDADPMCILEVLHPPRGGTIGSTNANSLVLSVEYAGRRILLPGDLERPGLNDVIAEEPRHYDVLLAPHHGSKWSEPGRLSGWCTPALVVISAGNRWSVDDSRQAFEAAGAEVLVTGEKGAIRVVVAPDSLYAQPCVGRPCRHDQIPR